MSFIIRNSSPLFKSASTIALWLVLVTSFTIQAAPPRLDVPYVPTPQAVVNRMLEMAQLQPDDFLVDLGSGDGRIVVTALRDWDLRSAMGVDIDPQRIAEAIENAQEAGVQDRATFVRADLFETDFSDASVLTMYLLQSVNLRLRPVILEKMTPGTRVVSHAFDMGDWHPDEQDTVNGSQVYMWIVPAQVNGHWNLVTTDGKDAALVLNQTYQRIEGNVTINGRAMSLSDPRLRGDNISFSVGTDRFVGTVQGDSIVPRDGSKDWHVQRR